MKKKTILVLLLVILFVGIIAASVVIAVSNRSQEKTPTREEILAELRALIDGQTINGRGKFPYLQAVLDGEIDYNAPKLNEETIREIIRKNGGIGENGKAQNGDFEGILADIAAIQPYPDYKGASITLYWENAQTGKMLIIREPGGEENRRISLCDFFRVDNEYPFGDGSYYSTIYPYTAEILYGPSGVGSSGALNPLSDWRGYARP